MSYGFCKARTEIGEEHRVLARIIPRPTGPGAHIREIDRKVQKPMALQVVDRVGNAVQAQIFSRSKRYEMHGAEPDGHRFGFGGFVIVDLQIEDLPLVRRGIVSTE